MEKKQISVEHVSEVAEAVTYLQQIVDSLKKGRVRIEHGDRSIDLEPSDEVKVAVKAKQKSDKASISFKISWRAAAVEEQAVAPEKEEDTSLRISSDAPKAVAAG